MTHHDLESPRLSLGKALNETLKRDVDTPVAITQSGQDFSAKDLICEIRALKERVSKHSSEKARWGVFTNSSINGLIAILGLFWSEKEPVLLPNIHRNTLSDLEDDVDGFVTDSPDVVSRKNLLVLGSSQQVLGQPCPTRRIVIPDTARLHLFTSGSSGQPEMIAKSLSNLETELFALEKVFSGLLKTAPVIATVSHQHIYGLLFRLLWPLAARRLIVDGLLHYPHEVSALFGKHPQACLVSSPAFLKRAGQLVEFPRHESEKSIVFSSGGALSPITSQQLQDTGRVTPIEIFGSTETGGIAFREQNPGLVNTPWTPLPSVQLRVTEGLLEVCSPYIETGTWWRTQDMVDIKNDHFILKGRADRIVKLEEKRVHLGDLEAFLMTSPLIEEVHALVPGDLNRQLCAVIVPSNKGWEALATVGRKAFCADLRKYLSTRFEAAAIPRRWRFVKQIPVNTQGKRQLQSLADFFGETNETSNLPEVVSSFVNHDKRNATMEFIVPSTIPALKGHFPERPIVAGVVQIHWVDRFSRQQMNLSSTAHKMDRIKFKSVLVPGVRCRMNVQWDKTKEIVVFEIKSGDTVFASGRLYYERKDG